MLKKTLAALALGSALFTAGQAMAADYKIDKEGQHAFIEFRIKHLGYSWLYGRFNDFDGSFTFDEKNPSADKVKVTINTNSVDTNHAERDKHLRSGDFLNVSKNPTATFEIHRSEGQRRQRRHHRQPDPERRDQAGHHQGQADRPGRRPVGRLPCRLRRQRHLKLKDFGIKMDLGPASQEVELLLSVEGIRQ